MDRIKWIFLGFAVMVMVGCSPTWPLVQDTRTSTPVPTIEPTVVITVTPAVESACNIKGVMASHIYHVQGQLTYKRTQVLAERGDRWFCTEQQALDAGFRKALK